MSAQSEGNYAEALQNYYEAMRLEIDSYDRSFILYNIGLIHTSNGEHTKALEYYFRALERNPILWLLSEPGSKSSMPFPSPYLFFTHSLTLETDSPMP
ncbi:Photosystem I assembly protein Ycf3 [Turnera subulata]|uniref:Photosystem I assembly protein Ycf3 n=1 Tax=Turnera subulata TaxID=218843 RepID=A0A9Q0GIY3_9ROSI|nr:Photosystem I assembly protein Ycf3 [Turnera subulata]